MSKMSIKAAAIAPVCLVTPVPVVQASVYDSNVVQQLHLTGGQKTAMEKLIRESRARRNHILRRHGIDPNAKPKMWRLMGASSELKANVARERAAAKKILTPQQLRLYDAVVKQTRRRIMSSF
jgi:hypothetical protein